MNALFYILNSSDCVQLIITLPCNIVDLCMIKVIFTLLSVTEVFPSKVISFPSPISLSLFCVLVNNTSICPVTSSRKLEANMNMIFSLINHKPLNNQSSSIDPTMLMTCLSFFPFSSHGQQLLYVNIISPMYHCKSFLNYLSAFN